MQQQPASHNELSSWLLPGTATIAAVAMGWGVLAASESVARNFRLSLYVLVNLVVFVDVFDFVLRLYFRKIHRASAGAGNFGTSVALDVGSYTDYQKQLHLRPYALLVSVHNAEDYIDGFLEAMEPYRQRFWIIDDGSTDDTCSRIRNAGWRILESGENRKKPAAIKRLLSMLPPEIETVIILDPDTRFRNTGPLGPEELETVIFEFQRSGMAALCPRIAVRRDGFLARLQELEYCMAFFVGRMSLADNVINSGISVYRRSALATALERHSLSVYAEDLENSTILLGAGERIYLDSRLEVETEGKTDWRGWFSQRVGWSFGLVKVYREHFADICQASRRRFSTGYQFFVYMGGFNLLMHPLKIVSLAFLSVSFAKCLDGLLGIGIVPDWPAAEPVYFLAAFAKFTLLSLAVLFVAVPREERRYLAPVVPLYLFYVLAQILPTTVGYADWISFRLRGRRFWGDHYENTTPLPQHTEGVPRLLGAR